MGLPKHAAPARAALTCTDLRNWARANLDHEIDHARPTARISFAVVQKTETHALFLVAARDAGKSVFEATCVIFALVNGSRGRVSQVARTGRIRRLGGDETGWKGALASALEQDLQVDPSLLQSLSTNLGREEESC